MPKMPDFSHLPVTIERGGIFSNRLTIEIDRYLVKVTERGWFGAVLCEWNAPISDFKGILCWSERVLVGGGENIEWVTSHYLELDHPDEEKSLELYSSEKEADTRRLWGVAARALQLPVLYGTGDGIVSRAPEDLNKTLRQLATEGKVSVDFDDQAPPPTGIVLEVAQGHQSEQQGSRPVTCQRVTLRDGLIRRCIEVTPNELCHYWKTPFGQFLHRTIRLADLESVDRYDSTPSQCSWGFAYFTYTSGVGATVEMESISYEQFWGRRASISVGGLADEQSHWLKNFILAAAIGRGGLRIGG